MKIIWNLALVASIVAAAGCTAPVESDAAGEQTGATSQAFGGVQCPTGPEIHACDLNCIAEHLGESCIQSCAMCTPGGLEVKSTPQAFGGAQCPTGPEIHACDLNCIAEHLGESCIQSCTWCSPGGLGSTPIEARVEAPKPESSGPCLTPQELADCDAHCREAKEGASCYLACATCY